MGINIFTNLVRYNRDCYNRVLYVKIILSFCKFDSSKSFCKKMMWGWGKLFSRKHNILGILNCHLSLKIAVVASRQYLLKVVLVAPLPPPLLLSPSSYIPIFRVGSHQSRYNDFLSIIWGCLSSFLSLCYLASYIHRFKNSYYIMENDIENARDCPFFETSRVLFWAFLSMK